MTRSRNSLLVASPLLLCLAALGGSGCAADSEVPSESPAEPHGPGEELGAARQAVLTLGDWTGWEPGQCVHGVYAFYDDRFGVDLLGTCAQAGDLGNCRNCGACMIWESEIINPDPALFNKYAWGTTTAQTYDIVVYPSAGGAYGYGHVACVDHTESDNPADYGSLFVMDSNWDGYESVADEVHTVNRQPYGLFRLKSLDTCDRQQGELTWSCDGAEEGLSCTQIAVPDDPASWTDNYLCTEHDLGLQWSSDGPIDGMHCTAVTETGGTTPSAWLDTYLCAPDQTPWELSWSSAGPLAGLSCVQWSEPAAGSFGDNYLCTTPVYEFSAGSFTFKADGPVAGKACVLVDEPSDPDTWSNNYFCSDANIGMKWSAGGPIDGMRCTLVDEPGDAQAAAWEDNFICVPSDSEHTLAWSHGGAIEGQSCVRWLDHEGDAGAWLDNWLCDDLPDAPPTSSAGAGGSSSGGDDDDGSRDDDGDGDGDGSDGDGGSTSASGKAADASRSSSSSGCTVAPLRTGGAGALAVLACVAALAVSRRRQR